MNSPISNFKAEEVLREMGFYMTLASEIKSSLTEIDWIWEGLVAAGSTTLLVAPPKMGKSCLTAGLMAAMMPTEEEFGGSFLGRKVSEGSAYILTEERLAPALWKERSYVHGINLHRLYLQERTRPRRYEYKEWETVCKHLAAWCDYKGLRLVVIDTLAEWWPCEDENDATRVRAAMEPLRYFTERDLGLLLLHHTNKSGVGRGSNRSRGSNFLPGSVEIIAEIQESGSNRVLRTQCRDGFGEHLEIHYGFAGEGQMVLRVIGAKSKPKEDLVTKRILEAIEEVKEDGRFRQQDLRNHLGMNLNTLTTKLKSLVKDGYLREDEAAHQKTFILT